MSRHDKNFPKHGMGKPPIPNKKRRLIHRKTRSMSFSKPKSKLGDRLQTQQREHGRSIKDLSECFDGTELYFLMKSLFTKMGKEFPLFEKRETKRLKNKLVQRINVRNLIEYLREEEKLPLHGVSEIAITQKDIKMIMGLIWGIIKRFHVAASTGDSELKGVSVTSYEKLIEWINKVYSRNGVDHQMGLNVEEWKRDKGKQLYWLIREIYVDKEGKMDEGEKVLTKFVDDFGSLYGPELVKGCIAFAKDKMGIADIAHVGEFLDFPEKLALTTYLSYYHIYYNNFTLKYKKEDNTKGKEKPRKMRREMSLVLLEQKYSEDGKDVDKINMHCERVLGMYQGEQYVFYMEEDILQIGDALFLDYEDITFLEREAQNEEKKCVFVVEIQWNLKFEWKFDPDFADTFEKILVQRIKAKAIRTTKFSVSGIREKDYDVLVGGKPIKVSLKNDYFGIEEKTVFYYHITGFEKNMDDEKVAYEIEADDGKEVKKFKIIFKDKSSEDFESLMLLYIDKYEYLDDEGDYDEEKDE